jgi:hypothetical protein
MFVSN